MEINLDKEKIFSNAKMNVSVVARDVKDSSGNSLYDTLFIQERDIPILEGFWSTALSTLLSEIAIFVKSSSAVSISLIPHRYNQDSITDLQELFGNYLSNKIVESWFSLKAVEFASIYNTKAEENMTGIKNRLYNKVEPQMKKFDRL